MYECILSKKSPVYARYVMKLIIKKSPIYHLCVDSTKFVEHKLVRPQRKEAPGVTNEPFASSSGDEEDDVMEEEYEDVAEEEEHVEETVRNRAPPPSSKRRSKNASNVPFSPRSKEEVRKESKKLSWLEKTMLCMGVDIRKEQYNVYTQSKHIVHN
jgi:hypothetical protein